MSRYRRQVLLTATVLAVVLTQLLSSPAFAAVPEPGPGRALWGGTTGLQARESALGRPLDVVRIYSQWETGPPQVSTADLRPIVTGGRRTLLYSSTINWGSWRKEARARNSDGDPTNDVAEPFCKTRPVVPGTTRPSGKSWFAAVATGDYDAALRRWLEQLAALSSETPALYVSFQHEADRLSDGQHSEYQPCVGTPAEYRAAWRRLRMVAEGSVGTPKPNLLRRGGGHLVLVAIYTDWGFWHTANNPGTKPRALVDVSTGQPLPGGSADDQSLHSARVTAWQPAAQDYDIAAIDVYNFSGSAGPNPNRVAVDDPATPVKESDQWLSLPVLLQPFMRWATNWAARPDGSKRPLMLAEYGSVPDPTRPGRRAAWFGDACRFLSAPAQARFHGAVYFDVAQWGLTTWRWQKTDGRWSAVGGPTGPDTRSIAAMGQLGRSTRFGGTNPCPA